ncbi:M16 family metallopeptidase [Silvibacterium dinghuense]|uniref:Insulinase family protein n=1 Tax=Silvibacterium dinghuense TaxID=1560006 RepID=A0A4Q1SEQ7_9BACT|nr:pitrilysin family protein [Silvibacterium dinghuense]RXS95418.1 insulinase family protein [Silvibacterium dinghuense]GGH13062.1 peptidase M16 [Silvibacterium dinghuense]
MRLWKRWTAAVALGMAAVTAGAQTAGEKVPYTYYKLPNGLKVVLSQDSTAPTVAVGVYYQIGFRIEPKDRTGFAHLFEHMMFQGSQNLGKMQFIQLIQKNGGILNGSTRFDFTNYFEVLPSNTLETVLWAEADRMRGLDITEANLTNQKGVVTNEVKVNVINQPYGGFPWLDMPQYANTNWYNAHNFYGDLADIQAATLEDVKNFFKTYYAPNNAVLVVVGDFETAQAKSWIEKYFASIPSANVPPLPDLTEPEQTAEKHASKEDKLAKKPALAFAYHMPPRLSKDWYAMGLLNQILLQGDDSLLVQELVKKDGYAASVDGGINELGNMYDYRGPMLFTASLIHDDNVSTEQIMGAVDKVVQGVIDKPVDETTLRRAQTKLVSSLYDDEGNLGLGKVDLFASFALFDDDPGKINTLVANFDKLTPADLQATAAKYLRPQNRTVLEITVAKQAAAPAGAKGGN